MGEPAGIGGEISVKAWLRCRQAGSTGFLLIGDPAYYQRAAAKLGADVRIIETDSTDEARAQFENALPVYPLELARPELPGTPDPVNAPVVLQAIEIAVGLALAGEASAIVTNPIQKASLYAAGFHHSGHTDYISELTGSGRRAVMMLAAPALKVVPVTVHLALAEAIQRLSTDLIVETAMVTAKALAEDFGLAEPRFSKHPFQQCLILHVATYDSDPLNEPGAHDFALRNPVSNQTDEIGSAIKELPYKPTAKQSRTTGHKHGAVLPKSALWAIAHSTISREAFHSPKGFVITAHLEGCPYTARSLYVDRQQVAH